MSGERLPSGWRLARAVELREVLRTGQRQRTPRLDIVWLATGRAHPRVAVVVPRHGRRVVARNRLRRRLREILRRRILPYLAPIDVVVRSRPPAYGATFADLVTDLEQWARSVSR